MDLVMGLGIMPGWREEEMERRWREEKRGEGGGCGKDCVYCTTSKDN